MHILSVCATEGGRRGEWAGSSRQPWIPARTQLWRPDGDRSLQPLRGNCQKFQFSAFSSSSSSAVACVRSYDIMVFIPLRDHCEWQVRESRYSRGINVRELTARSGQSAYSQCLFLFLFVFVFFFNLWGMTSVWKRLQRVGKKASKFQFVASYQELTLECTKKWWVRTR